MSNENATERASESAGYPRCTRCGKPVDEFRLISDSSRSGAIIAEYRCHGEGARQELPAEVARSAEKTGGLSGYTAFNDFTSGLLPSHEGDRA